MKFIDAISDSPGSGPGPSPVMLVYSNKHSLTVSPLADDWRSALKTSLATKEVLVTAIGSSRPTESLSHFQIDRQLLRELKSHKVSGSRSRQYEFVVALSPLDGAKRVTLATLDEAVIHVSALMKQRARTDYKPAVGIQLYALRRENLGQLEVLVKHFEASDSQEKDDSDVTEQSLPVGIGSELTNRYEQAREKFVAEFPLLASAEVATICSSKSKNRALLASKWRKAGKIFAVRYHGRVGYPKFQFDMVAGQPKAIISKILAVSNKDADKWHLALWFISPNSRLSRKRPVDLIDSQPIQVVKAAKAENMIEVF